MQCRQSGPGDLRFHPLRSCPRLGFRTHTYRRLSRDAYASAGGRDGPPAHSRSLKERLDDALSGLNKALLGSSFGDELQVAAGSPETATPADGRPEEATATVHQSAAPAEDTAAIESWDKVYAEPDWDGKDGRPRVRGNVLFGIVVVLAAVAAGALFNTLGRHRRQGAPLGERTPIAEVAPGGLPAEQAGRRMDARRSGEPDIVRAAGSSTFANSGATAAAPSSTPSPRSGTPAGTPAAATEREVAAGSFELDAHEVTAVADELSGEEEHAKHAWHEQHQPHLGGGAVSMAPHMEATAAAAAARSAVGPAAAPAAPAGSDSAGATTQGGAAPTAVPAGAAPKAQPSGAAAGDGALHRGDMHSPGGEAALTRIRQLQAQHLRELEQQWGTPHPMVSQQQQQGEGGKARMAPPAGASALAPFGSDEGWHQGGSLGQAQSQSARAQSAAAAEGAQDDSAARWEWEAARQGLQQGEDVFASEGETGEEQAFGQPSVLGSGEVAPAAAPAGMTLDAVAARAQVAQRAAAAAAQAAHRAADASAVAAEAAHRAAQQAQQAVSAATSAQAALTLHVDDAVEESMRVVQDAEAVAARAQREAEEAAAEAALAAARGTMSEVDAAQHARRAQQAAQLSRPYTVSEQVSAWWRTSRRAVATSAQRTQQAVTNMAQRTQQATSDAMQRAGQITASTAQQVKQTATGTVHNVQHMAGSAAERVENWREGAAWQAAQLWGQVGQAAANVAGNAKAAWAQLQEWVQLQFKGKGGGPAAGGSGGEVGPAAGPAGGSAGGAAGGEASS